MQVQGREELIDLLNLFSKITIHGKQAKQFQHACNITLEG